MAKVWMVIAEGVPGDMTTYINNIPSGTEIRMVTEDKLQNIPYIPTDECGLWDSWLGETLVSDPSGGRLHVDDVSCNDGGYGELIGVVDDGGLSGYNIGYGSGSQNQSQSPIGAIGIIAGVVVVSLCLAAVGTIASGLYLIITGKLDEALEDAGDFADKVGEAFKWVAVAGGVMLGGAAVVYFVRGFQDGRRSLE